MIKIQETRLKGLPRGMGKMVFLPQMIECFIMPDGDVLTVSNTGYSASRRKRKLTIILRRAIRVAG